MKNKKRKRRKKKQSSSKHNIIIKCLAVLIMLILILLFTCKKTIYAEIHHFFGSSILKKEYQYHHITSIVKQTSIDELLTPEEEVNIVSKKQDLYLETLHLGELDYPIDDTVLDIIRMIVNDIYQTNNSERCFVETTGNLSIQKEIENIPEVSANYHAYFKMNRTNPENLFQASNALFGKLDVGDVEDLTIAGAAVINWNEIYLFERTPESITVKEEQHSESLIYFLNGKVYYILATRLPEKLKPYKNSLWMMAYANMEKAESTIGDENKLYALIHYYLGNIGYNLLIRTKNNNSFYQKMKETTIQHLLTAQECIENPKYQYQIEVNTETNISNMLEDKYLSP